MDFQCRLSPELWTMIFRELSSSSECLHDIMKIRLTCKNFEALATPFLITSISCAPQFASLSALTAVSLHPVFSRSVKEVVYICSRRQFIRSLAEYRRALGYFSSFSKEEETDMENAYLLYRMYSSEQSQMEDSGELIARLCSALMRMPNVAKVTISPNLYCRRNEYEIFSLDPEPTYDEAFLTVARVLSLTGAKIRELDVECYDTYPTDDSTDGLSEDMFEKVSATNLHHCYNAFRSLRKVKLALDGDATSYGRYCLAKILSNATDLESIQITSDCNISQKHLLSTPTWIHLTWFGLNFTVVDQPDLLDFLRRHSSTLQVLNLECITLLNGTWQNFVENIKSFLSLRDVSISGYQEFGLGGMMKVDMEQAVLKSFLLGDGPCPQF